MALRGPAGVLYDIVVDPAHRGRGVGRLLLDATLAALAAKGAPRVVLSTAERNEPAQRLFARAGFRRTMIEMTREVGRVSLGPRALWPSRASAHESERVGGSARQERFHAECTRTGLEATENGLGRLHAHGGFTRRARRNDRRRTARPDRALRTAHRALRPRLKLLWPRGKIPAPTRNDAALFRSIRVIRVRVVRSPRNEIRLLRPTSDSARPISCAVAWPFAIVWLNVHFCASSCPADCAIVLGTRRRRHPHRHAPPPPRRVASSRVGHAAAGMRSVARARARPARAATRGSAPTR